MLKVLSTEALRQFKEEGYYSPVDILGADEVADFRARLEAFEAAQGAPLNGLQRNKTHLLFKWLDDLVHDARIVDIMEDILGPDILCWNTLSWTKEPGSGQYVSWHQDSNYWGLAGGEVVTAGESIEEIAEEIGLPVDNLAHTFHHYNEHAARGEDPLFHKQSDWLEPIEPVIAAVDITPGEHGIYVGFTLGGLETRPTGEVLTMDGDVIPGLYAAGRATCGMPRTAEGYGSGMSVGDVTFFGRQAGRRAAAQSSVSG